MSDPQLLGETFDTNIYSGIANHDSDQYLRRTFARAYAYAKPDVICFLGDLLDEGSVAADEPYKRYLNRFKNVFKTSASVTKFYIPGGMYSGDTESVLQILFTSVEWLKHCLQTSFLSIILTNSPICHFKSQAICSF